MIVMLTQVIAAILLILLFLYVFKKYPYKSSTSTLLTAAVFIMMFVVLNVFSRKIIIFGVEALKISIASIPLMISGFFLPPSWAYLVGIVVDVLGLIVSPTSFPFLGFTLNNVLICVIPALISQNLKRLDIDKLNKTITVVSAVLCVIACTYITTLSSAKIDQAIIELTLVRKLIIMGILVLLTVVIVVSIYGMRKFVDEKNAKLFTLWVLVVIINEVLINLICTPIWLQAMYGIPWYISMFIRVLKACIMIPLNMFVGFSLIKVLYQIRKSDII